MASNHFVVFAIVSVILLPMVAMATDYIVGGEKGWDIDVDYTAWASDKVFHVGDKLVFQHKPPHDVFSVDSNGFKNCIASGNGWIGGNVTITLLRPGKKWYICSYGEHCANHGQKLAINVEDSAPTPTPSPSPSPTPASSAAYGLALSWYQIFLATMVVAAVILV